MIIEHDGPNVLNTFPIPTTRQEQQDITDQCANHQHTFAATSATKEEEEIAAKGVLPDGTKPVKVAKRVWRPKATNVYEEPEAPLNDNLDWLFENLGKTAIREKAKVPDIRTDLIHWDDEKYTKEYEDSIQWRDCPNQWQPIFEAVVKEYWDVFAKEGMMRPILGYLFHVDTGKSKPICCKQPRYGPHESRVMTKLVEELEKKGLIEDDFGPWGAQVVLASKPNQGHVHWSQYIFRLCISYRKLNGITRPFQFYILRCDDAVETVGDAKYFITMDLDAGYWQVALAESSRDKTAFFTPDGKKHWLVMPMGILNAHAYFVCMTINFKKEWQELYKQDPKKAMQMLVEIIRKHKDKIEAILGEEAVANIEAKVTAALAETDPNASVIVDDVLLFDTTVIALIAYFITVLEILQKYRVTVNLRKTRFLPPRAEFVGRDLLPSGNAPAESKFGTIKKLCTPATFSDIQMINGLFGWYSPWIPHFEIEIQKWRDYVKQKPEKGEATEEEIKAKVSELWTEEDNKQLEKLKKAILDGPVLKRPNANRRFYLKTDWSCTAMGACLLQADVTEEAEEAMLREIKGGKCEFDKAISGLRLRPVAFISRLCVGKEKDYHSYVGEAATGLWGMRKFRQWLVGREFTWISDCSGLTKFFEGTADITHTIQRWRLELLSLNFTIVHRPARMLIECDLMSRYQGVVESWREQNENEHTDDPITAATWQITHPNLEWPRQHLKPRIEGTHTTHRTELATVCDTGKATWIIECTIDTFSKAFERLGGIPMVTARTSENEYWQEHHDIPDIVTFTKRLTRKVPPVEWVVVNNMENFRGGKADAVQRAIATAIQNGAHQVTITWQGATKQETTQRWNAFLSKTVKNNPNLRIKTRTVRGQTVQAHVDSEHTIMLMAPKRITKAWTQAIDDHHNDKYAQSPTIEDILDGPNDNYNGYCNMSKIEKHHVRVSDEHGIETVFPIHESDTIAPNLPPGTDMDHVFIRSTDAHAPATVRTLRPREHLALIGFTEKESMDLIKEERIPWKEIKKKVSAVAPIATWTHLLTGTFFNARMPQAKEYKTVAAYANDPKEAKQHMSALTNRAINKFTTLPIPTGEQWKEACATDPDINTIITALEQDREPNKTSLNNQMYWREYKNERLEVENGILFQFEEPKNRPIRQIKRAVVPTRLRPTIIAAYHSTPLAGHVGFHKTLYRITARFWWPGMTSEIREAVTGCGHCNAANAANHIKQKILQTTTIAEPFEICGMDIWFPGKCKSFMRSASPVLKKTLENKAVITYLCNTTGFATVAFISSVDSNNMARIAFSQFFTIRGMPRLILIDDGSENKGELITICQILGIEHHPVSPESHDGILNERFHRFLNKIQKIGAADMSTYEQWAMNSVFATYAWNASPVDGTDIQRAFAAVSKHFNFPMDTTAQQITGPPAKKRRTNSAQAILERIDIMFPLWWQQKELLKTLIEERREYHLQLKNSLRTQRTFEPGDLVMVRKQVQSKAIEGIPAKLVLKTKGPYRVIEKASEDSYRLQKIPGTSTMLRRQGSIPIKESAFRMTKIPSTVIIHKRVDTPDTRLANMNNILAHSPLEQQLGLVDFGKYAKAATNLPHAFDKIQDLWDTIEAPTEDSSDEEEAQEEEEATPPEIIDAIQLEAPRPINEDPTRRVRFQATDETQTTPATTRITTRETLPAKLQLQALYTKIQQSKDKLFAIAQHEQHQQQLVWYIVQVDMDETDKTRATTKGQYHCKWYAAKVNKAKTPHNECKFWPLIKEFTDEATFGDTNFVRPGKVEQFLHRHAETYAWYQKEVNLVEDGIEGPFDFATGFTIPEHIWAAIRKIAQQKHVDISNISSRNRRSNRK